MSMMLAGSRAPTGAGTSIGCRVPEPDPVRSVADFPWPDRPGRALARQRWPCPGGDRARGGKDLHGGPRLLAAATAKPRRALCADGPREPTSVQKKDFF